MEEKKNKKVKPTGIILIILIVLVGALIAFAALNKNAPISSGPGGRPGRPGGMQEPGEMVYTVLTRKIVPVDLANYLKFNGDVITETSVSIYPDTSGEVTDLYVSLGSYVQKGQVIAKIDPSLPGQVFVASPVKSTITGTVTALPYDVGDTVSSAQVPIATVGDLSDLQIVSYISEKNMADIAPGQKASITFEPFDGVTFSGTVSEISPVLDSSSRTLEIKISLDKRDSRIKSGMFGSVKLIIQEIRGTLAVPNEGIISSAEGDYVFLAGSSGQAEKVFVETGLSIDGTTEITSGLSVGDQVIVRGQTMLKDGSSVKIAD